MARKSILFGIVLILAVAQVAAGTWMNCFVIDSTGYESPFFISKGHIIIQYVHQNVAPLSFEFDLDGKSFHTLNIQTPEFVSGDVPNYIEGKVAITEDQLRDLGVGTHFMTLKLTEEDGTANWCNQTFDLIKEVKGLYLSTPKWFVAADEEFFVKLYLASGMPSFIEWTVRDSDGRLVLRRDEMRQNDLSPHLGKTLSLQDPGTYTIQVTVYNDLSIETDSMTINVQQPIGDIVLVTNSPRKFPDTTVDITLKFLGERLPTSAQYDVAYGDGDKGYEYSIPDGAREVSLQHRYASAGLYNLMVSVYNRISMETVTISVGILEDISDVSFAAYTQKDGYTVPQQVLPREYPVKFIAKAAGTIEYVTWNIDSTEFNTSATKTWYTFPAVSLYSASVTLVNSFTETSTQLSVNILESVTSLYLVNNGPVNLVNEITFVLFCKQQGTNPSFTVDLGDGTIRNLPIPERNPNVASYLPENLKIPFDPQEYFSTVFTHRYIKEGRYIAQANASNLVTHLVAESEAFIQLRPCQIPDINIRDGGSGYNSATKYKRNKSFRFSAYVTLDCQGAKKAKYEWRIFKIDDINSVPSADNKIELPKSVNSKVADLYIPKFTLDYGRYIFELTVVMVMKDGTIGVSSRVQSYIEVAQSPLVPKISGGSSIVVGWSHNITMDGSESFDPDFRGEFTGLFTWFCHLPNETTPFAEDTNELPNKEDLPEEGGCLGSGHFLQAGNSSTLHIPGKTFLGNQTYIFHLAITKPGRSSVGWADQTVLVMPGNPPAIVTKCLHNCDRFVNPSERFALRGRCADCDKETKNIYTWTIHSGSDAPLPQHLAEFRKVFHGRTKAYMSLPVDTFVGSQTYIIRLKIDSWSGASSRAEYTLQTNSAPTLGTCSVNPPEGIVLETKFNIECSGFEDSEGPLMYEAHAATGEQSVISAGKDKGTLVYYGVDPTFPPTLLPVGLPRKDFHVDIHIKVSDTLGASVGLKMTVKVKEPKVTEEIGDTVLAKALGEDSELNQLVESGSLQSATQLITTMTSMLNAEAEKTDVVGTDKEDKKRKKKRKEKRKQARDSLIDTLVRVEVRDMESLEQTSAAMAQVTQQKEEVSIQAQAKMTDMYQDMGQFLKEQSDSGVGGEVVESSARLLVSGISNMMGAAFSEIEEITKEQNETKTEDDENEPVISKEEVQERASKARDVTLSALSTLKDVQAAILHNKVPGEEPAELVTDSLSVLLGRQENWQLNGLGMETKDGGALFQLPPGMDKLVENTEGVDAETIIDTQMYHFKNNPFSWGSDGNQVTSQVTSLQITQADQSAVNITNLPTDINIMMTNNNATTPPLLPSINPDNNKTIYAFNWTNTDSSVLIHIKPKPLGDLAEQQAVEPQLKLCMQYGFPPNSTHKTACTTLPHEKVNTNDTFGNASLDMDLYSWLLNPEDLVGLGQYYITVQMDRIVGDSEDQSLEDSVDHLVYARSTQCIFWDEKQETWKSDGCKVGPYTSLTRTHCQCSHLTSFALSFFALPNALDLAKDIALFLQFLDNPVCVIAVMVVFVMSVTVGIWARRKDMVEAKRAKVIFLQDNDPRAHYRYHITVFTGIRRHAGTTSTITITLHGSFGDSQPHMLRSADAEQVILQQNSIDSFILTTTESLGIVTSVRVWHDNSGPSPEWYVSRILVHDLESDLWWYFLCRSWLAVDLRGSRIDKTFPMATEEDLNEFRHLVLSKSIRDIKDSHLWFSIFIKPPQSYFTRLQRAACCLVILLTSMVISIMFYDVPTNPDLQDYEFGAIQISPANILIGIQASLMSIPVSTAVMTLFRYSRPRNIALPDPLQGHFGSELSLLAHGFQNRVRRLTQYVHHPFHHHDEENSESGTPLENISVISSVENINNAGASSSYDLSTTSISSNTNESVSPVTEESHIEIIDETGQGSSASSWDGADTSSSINTNVIYETHMDYLFEKINKCRDLLYDPNSGRFKDEETRKRACRKFDFVMKLHGWEEAASDTDIHLREDGEEFSSHDAHEDDKKEEVIGDGFLPWWCIYVGWFLTISSSIVCAFFIMQYGLRYGWQTSLDWLVAMLVSFIQSVVFIQPVKVVVMAIVFAITLKRHELDDVGSQFYKNWKPPKIAADAEDESTESIRRYNYLRTVHAPFYRPPATSTVVKAREKRRISAKVHSMFRAFLGQLIFVFFILEIAYTQQNIDSFYLGKAQRDRYDSANEVSTLDDFYEWLPEFISETYDDPGNILLGGVRMRQVRVKPGTCTVPPTMIANFPQCKSPMKISTIDHGAYGPSWAFKSSHSHGLAWEYQHGRAVGGSYFSMMNMAFDTGGYIAYLGNKHETALSIAEELILNKWTDRNTWAVFIEWTIYNANVNLFSVNTILFEVDTIGALRGSAEYSIVRLYRYTSQYDIFVRVLEAVYVIIVLVMIYRDYHKWKALRRDFLDFWNGLNVMIILFSTCAIAMYALRHVIGVNAMDDYKRDRKQFVSFTRVAFLNQVVITLIGAIVFCATLKCAKVLRYNKSMFMLHCAIHNVFKQFLSFSLGMFLILICFSSYAYLAFHHTLVDFRTVLTSIETLFVAITGGIDQMEGIVEEFPFQAFLFYSVLACFGVFILFNLYVSFIMASFEEARRHPMECDDHDVVEAIINWIIDFFSTDKPPEVDEDLLIT